MTTRRQVPRPTALAILFLLLSGRAAPAVDTTWVFDGNGNWTDAAKWSNGEPNGASFNASINDLGHGVDVSLKNSRTIGSLSLGDGAELSMSPTALSVSLTALNGIVNDGKIELSDSSLAARTLTVTNGTLTNGTTGSLQFPSGNGGPDVMSANLINNGIVEIDQNTTFNKFNAAYTNNSQFTIAATKSLTVTSGTPTFEQAAGTLKIQGAFNQTGGTFKYSGGTIQGIPTLDGSTLNIGGGPASFRLMGTGTLNVSPSGVAAGQVLTLYGGLLNNFGYQAFYTSATGFTNYGTIALSSIDVPRMQFFSGAALKITSGTLTNASTGLLDFKPTLGDQVLSLYANLDNQGTVLVEATTNISGQYTNNGQLMISGLLSMSSNPYSQIGGTTFLNGGTLSYTATTDPVVFTGGRLTGSGSITAFVENVGATVDVDSLNISARYRQQSDATLIFEIGGTTTPRLDRIQIGGVAFLAGTLDVRLVDKGGGLYHPTLGQSFRVLSADLGVRDQFDNVSLPTLDPGLAWNVIYNPSNVMLQVVAAPEPSAIFLLLTIVFAGTPRRYHRTAPR